MEIIVPAFEPIPDNELEDVCGEEGDNVDTIEAAADDNAAAGGGCTAVVVSAVTAVDVASGCVGGEHSGTIICTSPHCTVVALLSVMVTVTAVVLGAAVDDVSVIIIVTTIMMFTWVDIGDTGILSL